MAATAPVQPDHGLPDQPQRKHWVARHKVWTAILAFLVIALAVRLAGCRSCQAD